MREDGTPVNVLEPNDFRVADVVEYLERPIDNFLNGGHGFYTLTLVPDVDQADRIVTVEAFKLALT